MMLATRRTAAWVATALLLLLVTAHARSTARLHHHHRLRHVIQHTAPKPHKVWTVPLVEAPMPDAKYRQAMIELRMQQERAVQSFLQLEDPDSQPLHLEVLPEHMICTYFGSVEVAGQTFKALLDTGSALFWVPSSDCTTARCAKHERIDKESEVYQEAPKVGKMEVAYLSGETSGEFAKLPVKFGEQSIEQVVGCADRVDVPLLDVVSWDGIIGLAYPSETLTSDDTPPFFDTIMESGVLKGAGLPNQFAYYINDGGGKFSLGGPDCSVFGKSGNACIDQFQFAKVSRAEYWQLQVKSIKLKFSDDRDDMQLPIADDLQGVVDTGTYLIYGPAGDVTRMLSAVEASTDCAKASTYPTVEFTLEGASGSSIKVSLTPEEYLMKYDVPDEGERCVVGISPDDADDWTFGQAFLRSHYVVFDRDEDRIGFAKVPVKLTTIKK